MIVKKYTVGMYQTNCYLLIDEKSKESAIIDPGDVCQSLISDISNNGYNVKYIIFTHGHFDHIGGMEFCMSIFDKSTVLMHKNDVLSILKEYDVFNTFMKNKENVVKNIALHNDSEKYFLGTNEICIIHTPGHSKGSISIYVDGILFSGDTLFKLSIGRTDFIDGDFEELKKSVKKLYKLPDNTVVYPGHGDSTTIIDEKINNPYVRAN